MYTILLYPEKHKPFSFLPFANSVSQFRPATFHKFLVLAAFLAFPTYSRKRFQVVALVEAAGGLPWPRLPTPCSGVTDSSAGAEPHVPVAIRRLPRGPEPPPLRLPSGGHRFVPRASGSVLSGHLFCFLDATLDQLLF